LLENFTRKYSSGQNSRRDFSTILGFSDLYSAIFPILVSELGVNYGYLNGIKKVFFVYLNSKWSMPQNNFSAPNNGDWNNE